MEETVENGRLGTAPGTASGMEPGIKGYRALGQMPTTECSVDPDRRSQTLLGLAKGARTVNH